MTSFYTEANIGASKDEGCFPFMSPFPCPFQREGGKEAKKKA
jgi:hypothetical protein